MTTNQPNSQAVATADAIADAQRAATEAERERLLRTVTMWRDLFIARRITAMDALDGIHGAIVDADLIDRVASSSRRARAGQRNAEAGRTAAGAVRVRGRE